MCQEDHPAALPLDCRGSHSALDAHLTELGFQIVYTRLLAAEPPHPSKETTMPARAA